MYSQPVRSVAPALAPQVAKRFASSSSATKSICQSRKGHLYGPKPVASEEVVCITKRRIAKAGCDERMGITLALAPVKINKPSTGVGARTFYTSATACGAHSYNEDHVVPDFYMQHKRRKNPDANDTTPPTNPPTSRSSKEPQTETIIESHGSLMDQLSDSILSDDLAASTMRRLKSKTPHEHYNEEGILVHPSGFVIPTPGEAEVPMSEKRVRDINLQTSAVAERVLEEGDYTDISAHTRLQENKVPYEVIEEDGSVSHPSGFVPPTAAHEFKYSDSSSVDNHVQDAVQRQRRRATTIHVSSDKEMEQRQKKSDAMFARDEDDAELIAELKAGIQQVTDKVSGGNQKRGIHTSAVLRTLTAAHSPVAPTAAKQSSEQDC
ncbi:hypothetical protein HWV62_20304 [Athelia sp. TMB]|nr:hypothetical protein HWV62_20304 [Athelia sp. TMB]